MEIIVLWKLYICIPNICVKVTQILENMTSVYAIRVIATLVDNKIYIRPKHDLLDKYL